MEASETTATRFLGALAGKFEGVLQFPFSGPTREDLAPGLRASIHRDYVIFYLVDDDTLTIVRVLHGARDIVTIAKDGGFND